MLLVWACTNHNKKSSSSKSSNSGYHSKSKGQSVEDFKKDFNKQLKEKEKFLKSFN